MLRDKMFTIEGVEAQCTRLRLHADHPIYQAHFPGNPITPGVCIVQIIGELLEERTGQALALKKVTNLKFITPISPVSDPVIDVVFTAIDVQNDEVKTKGTVMVGEKTMTKFSLVFKDKQK